MTKLFIIDDDELTCELLQTATCSLFSRVEVFNDARLFLQRKLYPTDIILLDLMMPNMDGIEVIRNLAKKKCPAALILMSGYDQGVLHSSEGLARDYGLTVVGNLGKPIAIKKLTSMLSAFILSPESENTPYTQVATEIITATSDNNAPFFNPGVEELVNAIHHKQLLLHYQPQLQMKTKSLIGVEALVRWQHPEFGLIYPDRFIQLAERSGVIGELTAEVIELAVNQSALWKNQGHVIKISLNISAQNITSLQLPEQLKTLININQLDPAMLTLEVTESALMGELTTALDILTRLRLKGFQLSIDDFGTGFSSLSQLHRIPFTELKIDQSFVMKMDKDPESCAIVETCIMLGHKLNMEVVAEGIEDQPTWQKLVDMDCDIGQGYFIARAMTAENLLRWKRSQQLII